MQIFGKKKEIRFRRVSVTAFIKENISGTCNNRIINFSFTRFTIAAARSILVGTTMFCSVCRRVVWKKLAISVVISCLLW